MAESREQIEAGIQEHGMWIMQHPETACLLMADSMRQVGAHYARSPLTKQAVAEVIELTLQVRAAFETITLALSAEQDGVDLGGVLGPIGAGRRRDNRLN